jgi:hypothetical protein
VLHALALRLQSGLPPLVQTHLQKHVVNVHAVKSLKRRQDCNVLAAVDQRPFDMAAVEMTLGARDQPQFSGQPIMIGELK